MIQTLEIQNFKSIRHLRLDCRRVNLFIGEPNTGKSNILEALGLFSVPHTWEIRDFVRMERMEDLFYNQDISQPVTVQWEGKFDHAPLMPHWAQVTADQEALQFTLSLSQGLVMEITYHGEGSPIAEKPPLLGTLFKFYRFSPSVVFARRPFGFLLPPRGENLPQILMVHKDLRRLVGEFFDSFGLKLVIKPAENKVEVQLREQEGLVVSIPYLSIADTLQRLIFYVAAMKTNQNAVLIFEEPEAHAFPLYTKYLAEHIALDSANQYFLSTHDPFFLRSLVEKTPLDEIAVFVVYLRESQTMLRPLTTRGDLESVLDMDAELFFNLDWFTGTPDTSESG